MDIIIRCPKCSKGYKFKDEGSDKPRLSNKINLNPKINCKCGNVYYWNKAEHTFQWSN